MTDPADRLARSPSAWEHALGRRWPSRAFRAQPRGATPVDEPKIEVLTDLAEANDVLAAAFWTDPPTRALFTDGPAGLRAVYDLVVPMMLKDPASILLGVRDEHGLASVAVCQGPNTDVPLLPILIKGLPLLWRLGLRSTRLLLRFHRDLERHSPLRPGELRLAILGTRPDAFGRGYGAALLKRIDAHAVSHGLTRTYLEASRDGYPRRLYERHGYHVIKEFESVAGPIVVMLNPLLAG
jgi:GNAT superfamily N-acetyltransferase